MSSNRLESLKKPSLKFKPKAVKRKLDIERAKDAPVTAPVKPPRGTSTRGRGRGGARGGRNRYEGTHIVSLGPLLAGLVSLGGPLLSLALDMFNGMETEQPEFLKEEGLSEIDMTKDTFNEPLFPVRARRDDPNAPQLQAGSAQPLEPSSALVTKLPSPVKSETPALAEIQEKKKELEVKIALETTDHLDSDEQSKLISDHQEILDIMGQENGTPFTLQLPALPTYIDGEKGGQIGQVRLHQSGKITMDLGNDIIVDLTRGSEVVFLQQLAKLDLAETVDEEVDVVDTHGRPVKGKLILMGPIGEKLIGMPKIG